MGLYTPDLVRERLEPRVSSTERAALFRDGRSVLSLGLSLSLSLSRRLSFRRWGTGGPRPTEESLSLACEGG